jgi:hypothetical protein
MIAKAGIVLFGAIAGGAAGLVIPLLVDRDVGGALAATIFAVLGTVAGGAAAVGLARRYFD